MRIRIEEPVANPLWLGSDRDQAQDFYRARYPAQVTGGRTADFLEAVDVSPRGEVGPRRRLSVMLPQDLAGLDRRLVVYGLGRPTVVRFTLARHPLVPDLIEAINEAGGNCWLDADDDWTLLPRRLEWYGWSQDPRDPHQSRLAMRDSITVAAGWFADSARAARGLACATPALADHIRHLNTATVLLPNTIDPSIVPPAKRPKTGQVTVGVSSSGFHSHDFELVLPALQWCAARPDVRIILFAWHPGLLSDLAGAQVREGIYSNWGMTYRFIPGLPFPQYLRAIGELDVALVPYFDAPHNRIKSNCKYLEYSLHATAGVYARLPPFECIVDGETGLLAATADEYKEGLIRLVEEAKLRRRIGEAARDDVIAHHSVEARADEIRAAVDQMAGAGDA